MATTGRPLSPHIQIYKPQLTSVLSITHRATGVFLCLGAVVFVWWVTALAIGPEAFATVRTALGSWLGRLFLFAWTFSFFFHLCNGIRHLLWDAGLGLDLPTVYASGKAGGRGRHRADARGLGSGLRGVARRRGPEAGRTR